MKCIWAPGGLGCCPFLGGGSVAVDSLFVVAAIVCGFLCLVLVLLCKLLSVLSSYVNILMGQR